jgi:hypothetical protein
MKPGDPSGRPPDDDTGKNAPSIETDLQNLVEMIRSFEVKLLGSTDEAETNFNKVARFFEIVGNRPSTTAQIIKGSGISRGALSNILYTDERVT